MMKKKSVAALFTAACLAAGSLAGCSGASSTASSEAADNTEASDATRVLIIPPLTTIPRISKMLPSFWTTLPTPTTQVCMSHWIRAIIKTLV